MLVERLKHRAEHLLAPLDIRIGGIRPWDIDVHGDAFYSRVLASGSLGLGESLAQGDSINSTDR